MTLQHAQALVAKDSKVVYNIEEMLDQLADASRSLRVFMDYLEQHPEALIRGKGGNE